MTVAFSCSEGSIYKCHCYTTVRREGSNHYNNSYNDSIKYVNTAVYGLVIIIYKMD